MNRLVLWGLLAVVPGIPAAAESFVVDPEAGNNTFSAVFDAALGERITAVSSSVSCRLNLDERTSTASGVCSVPLTAIRVDNEDTKTEHFQQWSTNKKDTPEGLQARSSVHGPAAPEAGARKAGKILGRYSLHRVWPPADGWRQGTRGGNGGTASNRGYFEEDDQNQSAPRPIQSRPLSDWPEIYRGVAVEGPVPRQHRRG